MINSYSEILIQFYVVRILAEELESIYKKIAQE